MEPQNLSRSKGNCKISSKNALSIRCYCSFYVYFVKQNMDISCNASSTTFFFFLFNFIFELYIIVLVLPNIKINPPQVYMCAPP